MVKRIPHVYLLDFEQGICQHWGVYSSERVEFFVGLVKSTLAANSASRWCPDDQAAISSLSCALTALSPFVRPYRPCCSHLGLDFCTDRDVAAHARLFSDELGRLAQNCLRDSLSDCSIDAVTVEDLNACERCSALRYWEDVRSSRERGENLSAPHPLTPAFSWILVDSSAQRVEVSADPRPFLIEAHQKLNRAEKTLYDLEEQRLGYRLEEDLQQQANVLNSLLSPRFTVTNELTFSFQAAAQTTPVLLALWREQIGKWFAVDTHPDCLEGRGWQDLSRDCG